MTLATKHLNLQTSSTDAFAENFDSHVGLVIGK